MNHEKYIRVQFDAEAFFGFSPKFNKLKGNENCRLLTFCRAIEDVFLE
jgi:hypothetical protein